MGKKAWAYFEQDAEYVEVTLTAYYPKEQRRRAGCDYVYATPWRKADAEGGCYCMDYILDNEPWSKDYDMPSDYDETVIMWPVGPTEGLPVAPQGVPDAAYEHDPQGRIRSTAIILHLSLKQEPDVQAGPAAVRADPAAAVPEWVLRALALLQRGKITCADVAAERGEAHGGKEW